MKAADVMTTDVICIEPEASIQDVAKLLLERHVSAVPVINTDGKLVGMVSEGDLVRRSEIGTERRSSWWLDMLSVNTELARE